SRRRDLKALGHAGAGARNRLASRLLQTDAARRLIVGELFLRFLHHQAGAGDFAAFLPVVAQGGRRQAIASILSLAEYFPPFSPPPPADTQAPVILIQSPLSGQSTTTNVTIVGQVTDVGTGVASLQAQTDAGVSLAVPFDASGRFAFDTNLPLDGS